MEVVGEGGGGVIEDGVQIFPVPLVMQKFFIASLRKDEPNEAGSSEILSGIGDFWSYREFLFTIRISETFKIGVFDQ